ncbi:SEC-C domain-containing protein [Actinoplanes aureus]|uniref:SEC-C domain-containing protein n=1 Tax=Actinoplanes aureus TaxID=2792083 RepID=A0A931C6H7_9ACTN|nr:SEC-C metal-binding domain-containing protein [Actinoplanes aureus]MBG0561323.1 SEC-C domain-containing protein [Actinoplanes aureus]
MPRKAELTSADLNDIRQSALGAADPLGVAADLAGAVESGRLADPRDAGLALTLAAEIAESRTKLDAALRYVERALEAYEKRDDSQVAAARALRARILFRVGRESEAIAELEPLRPLLTEYPDAAAYITSALVVAGRGREAEQWLTEAVQRALAERGAAEPASADDAGLLFFLLQQRHRLRHALGLPHDTHDNLAERLESKLAGATARTAEPAGDLLFWSQAEFGRMVARWPALTEAYGATWDEHRARLESELFRLTGAGRTDLALLPGSVTGLAAHAGTDGDPASAESRAGYANRLAAGTAKIGWPPERNAACWCGSGLKYKKCCLPRSRG